MVRNTHKNSICFQQYSKIFLIFANDKNETCESAFNISYFLGMESIKQFNNTTEIVIDGLRADLQSGSRLSIAAA